MREFKLNLGEQDIIVQLPDNLEITNQEIIGTIAIEMQDQIASGKARVTIRIWPCIICGKRYKAQTRLLKHLESHENQLQAIKDGPLKKVYENPEPLEPKSEELAS